MLVQAKVSIKRLSRIINFLLLTTPSFLVANTFPLQGCQHDPASSNRSRLCRILFTPWGKDPRSIHDIMDFQTCYAYDPSARCKSRPVKKRKVEPLQGLQTSWPLRRSLYQQLWAKQQARLKVTLFLPPQHHHLTKLSELAPRDQRIYHQSDLCFCCIYRSPSHPWQSFFSNHPHWSKYCIARSTVFSII